MAGSLSRRKFLKDCGSLPPTCALATIVAGLVNPEGPFHDSHADRKFVGRCEEVIYQDANACAYLVELNGGDYTIGFGPPNLGSVSDWEQPELIAGHIPSVVFHRQLRQTQRTKLEKLLPRFA